MNPLGNTFGTVALAAGVAAAAVALAGWRLGGGSHATPARVSLEVAASSELDVRPAGGEVSAALAPSAPGAGLARTMRVRNATAAALEVRVAASATDPRLLRLVSLRLVSSGRTLFRGPLARLANPSARALRLRRRATARVTARLWIPPTRSPEWHGRVGTVTIRFVSRRA